MSNIYQKRNGTLVEVPVQNSSPSIAFAQPAVNTLPSSSEATASISSLGTNIFQMELGIPRGIGGSGGIPDYTNPLDQTLTFDNENTYTGTASKDGLLAITILNNTGAEANDIYGVLMINGARVLGLKINMSISGTLTLSGLVGKGDAISFITNLANIYTSVIYPFKSLYNYTEEEQEIGTWIDGKTVYRKVIEFTTGNAVLSSASIDLGVTVDSLVNLYGHMYYGNGSIRTFNTPELENTGAYSLSSLRINATRTAIIELHNNDGQNSLPAIAIVEYTKATD